MAATEEKENMLRLYVEDSQMEWVYEQHQKGIYLYANGYVNNIRKVHIFIQMGM